MTTTLFGNNFNNTGFFVYYKKYIYPVFRLVVSVAFQWVSCDSNTLHYLRAFFSILLIFNNTVHSSSFSSSSINHSLSFRSALWLGEKLRSTLWHVLFFTNTRSSLPTWIGWFIWISKAKRILCFIHMDRF